MTELSSVSEGGSRSAPEANRETNRRRDLLRDIGQRRGTKVISYFLSDRNVSAAQIAEDAVRPMYDHLRAAGKGSRIDLFLYSVGGLTEIPWRIVTMIREYAEDFSVLVPYKAMSAATLIALGADEILMGSKGELGPIDPQLGVRRGGEGGTLIEEQVAVEDVMSYIQFIREKAGLSDQSALSQPIVSLVDKLTPSVLGSINRAHSHIRSVARKLLTSRTKGQPLDEQRMQVIIETLAEKTYQHGHAIGRKEAKDIGLAVVDADPEIEESMWQLFEEYESLCQLRTTVDPRTYVPAGEEERTEPVTMGAIESVPLAHHFQGELKGRVKRQMPPQLTLNVNINLQLPAGIQPQQLPAASQELLQNMLQQLQSQAQATVEQELRRQLPAVGFEVWVQNGAWREIQPWA